MTEPRTPASRQRGANGRFVGGTAARSTAKPSSAAKPAGTQPAPPVEVAGHLELYLLRHADAGDPAAWTGDDSERPLSKKGRRQAKRLGQLLDDLRFRSDALITSPKVRAAQTATRLAKEIGVDVLTDERLGGGFSEPQLSELVGQLGPAFRRVVLVGHDPDFSDLASFLVGARIALAKGALVRIDLGDRAVGAGTGALRWLLPPDAITG